MGSINIIKLLRCPLSKEKGVVDKSREKEMFGNSENRIQDSFVMVQKSCKIIICDGQSNFKSKNEATV